MSFDGESVSSGISFQNELLMLSQHVDSLLPECWLDFVSCSEKILSPSARSSIRCEVAQLLIPSEVPLSYRVEDSITACTAFKFSNGNLENLLFLFKNAKSDPCSIATQSS